LYCKYAPTVPDHHLPCFQRSSCEPGQFSGRTPVSHLVYHRYMLPRLCALGVRNPSALRIHSESVLWPFLRLAILSRALNFVLYQRPNLSHTSSLHPTLKSSGHRPNSSPPLRLSALPHRKPGTITCGYALLARVHGFTNVRNSPMAECTRSRKTPAPLREMTMASTLHSQKDPRVCITSACLPIATGVWRPLGSRARISDGIMDWKAPGHYLGTTSGLE
jgi:hypothetical protein